MADSKISALASGAAGISTTDVFPIARSSANFKLSLGDVFTLASGTVTNPATGSPYSFAAISISGTATVATGVFNTGITINCPITSSNGAGTLNQLLASNGPAAAPKFVNNFPVGGIIMWSGAIANIPSGWALCDGTNGTPDLRNRFVIGAVQDASGVPQTTVTGSNTQTGGSKDSVVVAHSHGITDPGHHHTYQTLNFAIDAGQPEQAVNNDMYWWTNNTSDAFTGITINSNGVSGTNQNLPPYYALAFIMKTVY